MRDDVTAGLRIGGIVPFTTTDFPGRLAAVVFVQGCPWRCAYCHNPHLVPAFSDTGTQHRWSDVLRWFERRIGLLDGVVFSGGEPTAQAGIVEAIRGVRDRGFQIALHTAGAYPRRLQALLPDVDWVGLDIKASHADYDVVTGIAASGDAAFESLDIMLASGVEFEVRTTVHPILTPAAALRILARELASRGVVRWVLQPFRPVGCDDEAAVAVAPRGATIDETLISELRECGAQIAVR